MQYKITKVFKKTGTSEKTGEAWNKILIQTESTGTDWLSGWANELNADWKVGNEVKLKLTEREYNGKKYYDYDIIMPEAPKVVANKEAPKTSTEMSLRLLKLEAQMEVVAKKLGLETVEEDEIEKLRKEMGEVNPEDIPF